VGELEVNGQRFQALQRDVNGGERLFRQMERIWALERNIASGGCAKRIPERFACIRHVSWAYGRCMLEFVRDGDEVEDDGAELGGIEGR